MSSTELLRFEAFSTSIATAFWTVLARKKLNELCLDDSEISIWGRFSAGQPGKTPRLHLNEESFAAPVVSPSGAPSSSLLEGVLEGSIKLFNTMGEFRACKRAVLSQSILDEIETCGAKGDFEAYRRACRFRIVAFADLKKHCYTYSVLYPTPFSADALPRYVSVVVPAGETVAALTTRLAPPHAPLDRISGEWAAIDAASGTIEGVLSWPARIVVFWLYLQRVQEPRITILRQGSAQIYALSLGGGEDDQSLTAPNQLTGWEKDLTGQLAPITVDLAPLMDPKRLAAEAADLNLKLIKWRLSPQLDLQVFRSSRALLFGAGTLGCNVARLLLSLFVFDDCLGGGKSKAQVAATRALAIAPNANVCGVGLEIPMPGHLVADAVKTEQTLDALFKLVEEHDILFLLTDSRESRWIPTVLGSALGKIVITIALGFDSFVAMRGGSDTPVEGLRLACYFCQDARGLSDTLSDRTLDQQCTVSRPGASMMAAALGVELAASLLQHPLKTHAPATQSRAATDALPADASLLGIVPHQVRGFLGHFQLMQLVGEACACCTACSAQIGEAVRREGVPFLLRCLQDFSLAESISGMAALHQSGRAAAEEAELEQAEGEGDSVAVGDGGGDEFCLI